MPKAQPRRTIRRGLRLRIPASRWQRALFGITAALALVGCTLLGYYYVQFSRIIDARLHAESDRVIPRVFARPLALRTGQGLTENELVARLNDVGYTEKSRAERPGEFALERDGVVLIPRGGDHAGKPVRIAFAKLPVAQASPRAAAATGRIQGVIAGGQVVDEVTLDPPMLAGLVTATREKRRRVPIASIPERMRHAVMAIEDRRFYGHPGIDPISVVGAVITNLRSDRRYPVGRSTVTQQLSRMFFLSAEFNAELQSGTRGRSWESYRRKALEAFMAVILETKATKDEILEHYLNDVYLGNRGSFALHGVAEASRIFFGKDVSNISLSEAALIAGVIQNPYQHSPFVNAERSKERRNVVLSSMAEADFITRAVAERASNDPIAVVTRAVDNEAPYFVDYLGEELQADFPGVTQRAGALDIYTTLDLNLQRYAQDSVRDGLAKVDLALSKRRIKPGPAQASLVAIDPRSGEILALVGGRFYNQSQFNRATGARRQPGSTFKPFVYLAAFERAAEEGRSDLTPATMVWDEPTTWNYDAQAWTPRNYDGEYDGQISLRRALALSRNIATIKIAEQVGFEQIANLWKKTKVGKAPPQGYPSIALGVFELTPMELASAYTAFATGGVIKPLHGIARVLSGEDSVASVSVDGPRIARESTTFLVTHMMRSVLNEGTGAGARGAGFALDAAGKSGTTNDLRDAWFVGFTPELLAVVWVGFDDNTPLGLSGSQAALPIWTEFMKKALAGHGNVAFDTPEGVSFIEIDRDTGRLALPTCPRVTNEAFLTGTEPLEICDLHRW
ncbi:MAG TPA: PBP1A family penicillin-binding protein [Vicinamibacterales bacterium]|nr:PBP1A family penicillin-binding protein [Vicinamibacterales bacterium]